jgi:hypothetical protein
VAGVGEQLLDHAEQRRGLVRHHLNGSVMVPQRYLEESSGGRQVPPAGQVHVDDLAGLVDRPVQVTPDTGDLDVGLVHEPAIPNGVATRPCHLDQERREPLHPPEDRDVVDVDASLGEQLLDVAVRQVVRRYQRTARMMTSRGNRKPANDLETSGANARRRFTAPRSPTRTRSANATFLKELWMSRAAVRRAVTALTWGLITTLAVSRRAELARPGGG